MNLAFDPPHFIGVQIVTGFLRPVREEGGSLGVMVI